MENRINVAELLKNYPKGMELDCILFNNPVTLDEVADIDEYPCPITVTTIDGDVETFTKYGQYLNRKDAVCVIFPKGKTTWEGFVPPCQFKDGDILATDLGSVFYLNTRLNTNEYYGCYVGIGGDGSFHICEPFAYKECCGFATKEEKEKLFKAIKENGCKWNPETKTFEELIEPEFKIGDKITNGKISITIGYIDDEYYYEIGKNITTRLFIKNQDEWNLVPNKFDINTLKPFDSRVLVRDYSYEVWKVSFWGCLIDNQYGFKYDTTRGRYRQCIPYEGNEHLLGKTSDCIDYYKNWK